MHLRRNANLITPKAKVKTTKVNSPNTTGGISAPRSPTASNSESFLYSVKGFPPIVSPLSPSANQRSCFKPVWIIRPSSAIHDVCLHFGKEPLPSDHYSLCKMTIIILFEAFTAKYIHGKGSANNRRYFRNVIQQLWK